jgi:hypothetical protein
MSLLLTGASEVDALRETIEQANSILTPEMSRYKIGDKVSHPVTNEVAEVIGYDGDGMPILRKLK